MFRLVRRATLIDAFLYYGGVLLVAIAFRLAFSGLFNGTVSESTVLTTAAYIALTVCILLTSAAVTGFLCLDRTRGSIAMVKVVLLAATPVYLFGWIPVPLITVASDLWSLVLLIKGVEVMARKSIGSAMAIVVMLVVAAAFLQLLGAMYTFLFR